MKKIIPLFFFYLFNNLPINAQENSSCDSLYLKSIIHIQSNDPCLIIAANYVFTHPLYGNTKVYYNYMGFILTWMEQTPDFTFTLNEKIISLCKDDNLSLFNVYLTCLAKAALENKSGYVSEALRLFTAYLKNPENKVKATSKIKKMIADVEEGKLEKYI